MANYLQLFQSKPDDFRLYKTERAGEIELLYKKEINLVTINANTKHKEAYSKFSALGLSDTGSYIHAHDSLVLAMLLDLDNNSDTEVELDAELEEQDLFPNGITTGPYSHRKHHSLNWIQRVQQSVPLKKKKKPHFPPISKRHTLRFDTEDPNIMIGFTNTGKSKIIKLKPQEKISITYTPIITLEDCPCCKQTDKELVNVPKNYQHLMKNNITRFCKECKFINNMFVV